MAQLWAPPVPRYLGLLFAQVSTARYPPSGTKGGSLAPKRRQPSRKRERDSQHSFTRPPSQSSCSHRPPFPLSAYRYTPDSSMFYFVTPHRDPGGTRSIQAGARRLAYKSASSEARTRAQQLSPPSADRTAAQYLLEASIPIHSGTTTSCFDEPNSMLIHRFTSRRWVAPNSSRTPCSS